MQTTAVIIGAGHAGLAMSSRLTELSIDHVVLERGQVANSWRTERWDSLRLLTPNWQSQLPGHSYSGDDPDGFMTMPDIIGFIDRYAEVIAAPVRDNTTVTDLRAINGDPTGGYEVHTNHGIWTCQSVVIAAGPANIANVPAIATQIPETVRTFNPMTYRNPSQLREGGVLVVGGSATGAQLAQEIQDHGHQVTLSLGEHVRMPRIYRGRDIFWWMDRSGILDERYDEIDDLTRGRNIPSPQLIGTPDRRTIDLNTLREAGIAVVGRLGSVTDGTAWFSGGLRNTCNLADLKLKRLLNGFDEWADETGCSDVDRPERFAPTVRDEHPVTSINLAEAGITNVLWATGYRPDYSWLNVDVLDRRGKIRHDGGVIDNAPGLYLVGGSLLRRRRSSFLNGAAQDSADLSTHLHRHLGGSVSKV